MTVEAHEIIIRSIEYALNQANYWSRKQLSQRSGGLHHGFDTSKFVASSLFYLPVQAKGGEDESYFCDFSGRELDPILWVENAIVHDTSVSRTAVAYEDQDEGPRTDNFSIGIEGLLQQIASKGRPRYDDWIKITWATIRVCNGERDTAISLMQQFFPEERSGEYAVLAKDWDSSRSPGWRCLNSMAAA